MDFAYRLFSFLKALIPAAVILLPIMFYYLYRRNLLRTKKDILLKEIEQGSIVDPEMLAKSLTNPVTEEHRLQNSLRIGIIFSFAGVVITVATFVFYSYLRGVYATRANGSTFNMDAHYAGSNPGVGSGSHRARCRSCLPGILFQSKEEDEQDGVTADDPGAIHSRNLHLAGAPQKVPAWHVPWGRLHRR